MTTAIHFPEPVTIEDPITLPPLPVTRNGWRVAAKWLAIGFGVVVTVAFLLAAFNSRPTPNSLPVEAAGTAELAVRQHLSQSGDHYVAASAVVSSSNQEEQWTVGVTVDLLARSEGGYVPAGTQHFEVTVADLGLGWQLLSGPAHVAAPDRQEPRLVELAPARPTPMTDAVQQYLDWLLVGQPGGYDGSRPTPPPYQRVTITGLATTSASDGRTAVQVAATGVDQFGHDINLRYDLEVLTQQGTWVVAANDS